MVKLSNVGLLVVLFSAAAFGRQAFQGSCTKGGQVAITSGISSTTKILASYPGCTVSVFNHGLATLATIFDDNGVSLANPFTASTLNGVWLFTASNGHYDVVLSGGTPSFPTPETITDILLNDPTASNTVTATAFISASANPATSGVLQVASADTLACWKSNLGGPDLCFTKNSSDVVDLNTALTVHGPFSTTGNPITASTITGTTGTFSGAITGASYSGGAIAGTTGTFSGAVTATGISGTTGTFSGAITGTGYSGGAISGTTGTFTSNVSAGGTLGVTGASTLGTITASGNVPTSPALGATGGALNVQKTTGGTAIYNARFLDSFGNTNAQIIGLDVEQLINPGGSVNYLTFGQVTEVATPTTNTATFTGGDQTATYGSFSHFGSGAINSISGITGEGFNSGPATATLVKGASGTANCGGVVVNGIPNQTQTPTNNGNCTNLRAVDGTAHNFSSGTVTNAVDLYAEAVQNTGGGTITNGYGLYVADQTAATNNFAIKTGVGKVEIGDVAVLDSTLQASGTVGVGTTPPTGVGLQVINPSLSGVFQFGIQSAILTSSAATSEGDGVTARADTAAAAFTQTLNVGVHATTPTVGAGSTITEWNGLRVEKTPTAGTSCSIKLAGSTSGTTCINPTAVALGTITFPAATGTIALVSGTGTFSCVNVTPVTVSANVTTDQILMACTIPAGTLNTAAKTLSIQGAGVYSTPAGSTSTVNVKIKLCTVSGCGSGTVITLASVTSAALGAIQATNDPFNFQLFSSTQTTGASAAFEAHGNLTIDISALTTAAEAVYADGNTATVGTIDSTAQLFLQITGAFSAGSASNSITQRQLTAESVN